ncbi:hypothetical protein ILFOPFJJ_05695 [Ensifer psoraleae]|nr:hypothetical protein [Sinorhizobium psoraleae]
MQGVAGEGIKTVLLPAVFGLLAFVCNGWAPEGRLHRADGEMKAWRSVLPTQGGPRKDRLQTGHSSQYDLFV